MKEQPMWIYGLIFLLVGGLPGMAVANGYVESSGSYTEGETIRGDRYDTGGNKKVTLGTQVSGENATATEVNTSGVMVVEQEYKYVRVAADGQVKASAGFVHGIACSTTAGAVATAGALTLYDNTAESGTVIQTIGIPASAFVPFFIPIDVFATTGLYLGYDATAAGVNCTVTYR